MSNSNEGMGLVALLWIGTIAVSILSGILAWNWIEPHNFFGGVAFLLAWSVLSYIGHIIFGGIVSFLGR